MLVLWMPTTAPNSVPAQTRRLPSGRIATTSQANPMPVNPREGHLNAIRAACGGTRTKVPTAYRPDENERERLREV